MRTYLPSPHFWAFTWITICVKQAWGTICIASNTSIETRCLEPVRRYIDKHGTDFGPEKLTSYCQTVSLSKHCMQGWGICLENAHYVYEDFTSKIHYRCEGHIMGLPYWGGILTVVLLVTTCLLIVLIGVVIYFRNSSKKPKHMQEDGLTDDQTTLLGKSRPTAFYTESGD